MRPWLIAPLLLLAACGAKTGLGDPSEPDAGEDADTGVPPPPFDSGLPIPDGTIPDAEACPAPCNDGIFCNGREVCDARSGTCVRGPAPTCDDDSECTVDTCDPRTDSCSNVEMERDEDRDGVGACSGDCDDTEPLATPGTPETCDEIDNDCDGSVDEGVLSECGDCRPGCMLTTLPDEDGWDTDGDDANGVETDPDGALTLDRTRTENAFAWIANTRFGTLTKIDTRDGSQAAEYDSVLEGPDNGAKPANEECLTEVEGGNCPSRTAVDLQGAVYVANRAFFAQGTVTKIAGFEEDCVDRNGNGTIETSEDVDGDGVIEHDVAGEYLGQQDECILWTVDVGGDNGVPRAVAIAADGTVWVGLNLGMRVVQLSPADGAVLDTVGLAGTRRFRPYGGAIDSVGRLWLTEAGSGRILAIDTSSGSIVIERTAVSREGCSGSYGIAVDDQDRVWIAGFQCEYAFGYDPATDLWRDVYLPDSGAGRGIAADDRGFVYMAASHEWINVGVGGVSLGPEIARVTRFRASDGGDVTVFGTADDPLPGLAPVGVGLDHQRRIWIVNQSSSTATMIDPDTGMVNEHPTGDTPYTYSDFTGFALRTFTAPNGFLRTVVEGCATGPTEWEQLRWDVQLPPRTEIEIRVRTASTRAGLSASSWIGPFRTEPADLTTPPGPVPTRRFMELEITLVSDAEANTPTLRTVTVQYNCPG